MKNITLSLPDSLLEKLKDKAHEKKISLNKLARQVLEKEVENPDSWYEEYQKVKAEVGPAPKSWKWNRDELYEDMLS